MRRFALRWIIASLLLAFPLADQTVKGQVAQHDRLELKKLAVPAARATTIATRLSLQYRDIAGVQIAPDVQNQQLIVMAPQSAQESIAHDLNLLLSAAEPMATGGVSTVGTASPLRTHLHQITCREFEESVKLFSDSPLPVTTSGDGVRIAFQMTSSRMRGTTVEVDRRTNLVTVNAPPESMEAWQKLIEALDQRPRSTAEVVRLVRFEQAEPEPIQKAIRLLRNLKTPTNEAAKAKQPVFRNAVFQQDAGGQAEPAGDGNADAIGVDGADTGPLGEPEIQIIPELGQVIIKGTKRDAQRIMDLIKQIEEQSKLTKPDIEVVELKHADGNAVATLLKQLYDDVLSARQGEVSITSLDAPNALLLIGRKEAIAGLKELIDKIDQPISDSSRMRVFRLRNASAVDAEQTIRDFFTDRPGSGDELRPGVGSRVRVLSDYRTNSLIVSAAPRDMLEVTRLVNDLDIQQTAAQSEIKVFQLNNAVAEELATVLQDAITGQGEGDGEATNPSTSVSIVTIDSETNQVLDSGVLTGAFVTADPGANAIVVRAPSSSMALIGELIRQLDRAPGVDSLVKVFTIQNGDALQLTTALQDLFGSDAATQGTSVGGANLAGLPAATAGTDSSLVPLRFSTDQRTNSIVASGSAEDLEVVESILLRLDSEGFADRITEVIWLRHQAATDVALAIQSYVQQRTTTVNTIQQFQQGLGPYDLPDRDLIVVAEPVSNSVLLSVSPRLYEDVRRLIDKLDRRPPMVMIQVMMAEVNLNDTFEIGGEFGLQESLLYDRGVAAASLPGAGAPSVPGFNFNNAGLPNANSLNQSTLATRGVTSFGVGTTNSALGYGGFVLSAASDSVSMLLRTLQDANRLQILSRPQINTLDNTEAVVQVGRTIARVTGVINNVSNTQVVTQDIPVGLILRVRPRVGSDGLIIMNIDVTRSDRDTANGTIVPAGDGTTVFIDDILETTSQSVVAAYNGQTVVFGGLIQKTRANFSRRVPFVSEIPILGHMFKYDQETETRNELLLVLTPTLISGQEDLDYIKEVESSRMSWCLADVVEAHGDVGLSGGYGLWGPAVGNTIYPDLQPTVDEVVIHETHGNQDQLLDSSEHFYGEVIDEQSVMQSVPGPSEFLLGPSEPGIAEPGFDSMLPSPDPSELPPVAVPPNERRPNELPPNGPLPNELLPNELLPDGLLPRAPAMESSPQSRFTPIDSPLTVKQTSFPTLTSQHAPLIDNAKQAHWIVSPWSVAKPVNDANRATKPTRIGGGRSLTDGQSSTSSQP